MDKQAIIEQTAGYVKGILEGEGSGHDWWHIQRVRNLALAIGREEKADLYIVEMAALLHDIGDPKLCDGDKTVAPKLIGGKLAELGVEKSEREQIMYVISNMSFSKYLDGKEVKKSIEFKCVQDADRLDAIGATGIARCFAYGGYKGRVLYDPKVKPREELTSEAYHATSVNTDTLNTDTLSHFYEKLLLLKDLINTNTAKMMAKERHRFMEDFLSRFHQEWEGKL